MNCKIPNYLKPGDKIGIVAPARKVTPSDMEPVIENIKKRGFIPLVGKNIYSTFHQFAGTDDERACDFQEMLDDPEIKAILCARGGYGSVRIISKLDFKKFTQNPKWICGYSDITVFHSHIQKNLKISTLHCTMPIHFGDKEYDPKSLDTLFVALSGGSLSYTWQSGKFNKPGIATGVLTGGNLSILYSLRGTRYDLDTRNKILFFEDLDEYLYHIDRMLSNLEIGGVFSSVLGVIVGSLAEMKDNAVPYGKTATEIVSEHLINFEIPICFGAPVGHQKSNYALKLGTVVNLDVSTEKVNLWFH